MELIQETDSLANFKENTQEAIDRLKSSGRPLVLTVEGSAELVVLAKESYQRMLAIMDRAQAIEGIQRGLDSMKRGEGRPAEEVFEEIRQRHGIPRQA